ncbi:hypothetical protein HDV00_002508 [Rhizophlyctis rosea]|nr:hypothetical protein HDV00_002508 [Rhizophlyctis rosea]
MSALFRIVQDDHPPIPDVSSKLLNDFLLECFQKDHNLRVSAKKLLRHPWIQNARKKVGVQIVAEPEREPERLRIIPVEDSWAKKHSPNFTSTSSMMSLSSATSETAVNSVKIASRETEAPRFPSRPQQSVVEIDLDDDTNWEADFEESITWPARPKEPERVKEPERPVAKPPPAPEPKPKPPSQLAPTTSGDLEEDTDVWDEDFEVPDTDVTIKLTKTAASASQPRLAVDNAQPTVSQSKTTNVLPTGKPVMINQYVEDVSMDEEDYSDVFGKEFSGAVAQPRRLSEADSDLGMDSDEDDPFLSMFEDDVGETALKDKQAKLNVTVMDLVRKIRPEQKANALIDTCDELVNIFKEHPETRRNLIIHHCVMPIVEMLENTQDNNVIVRILKVINQSIADNLEIQENLCLLGGIPIIMSYSNRLTHQEVRREAAIFVTQMCHASTLTLQMFISCRGLPVLVDMLDDDYESRKDLIWMAVDGIGCIFELQGPTPKNDFCRLFAKHNMLPLLAHNLHSTNCDRDLRAVDVTTKIVHILLIFSQAEAPVKEALAARSCIEVLVRELHNLPPFHIVNMLKCMKNISMHSNTLESLEKAHLIEELCEMLDLRDSPFFSDIQNQVLNALFNLCRINKTRQEIAARAGAVPHLQRFVRLNSPLKQFALPLLCEMAHAGRTCRDILWQCDALSSYLALLSDAYWQVNALEAIFVWLSDDTVRIGATLASPKQVETLMQSFISAKSTNFESILSTLQKILAVCPAICVGIARPPFVAKLLERLGNGKAQVRLNLLRCLVSLLESVGVEARREVVEQFGLAEIAEGLSREDPAILVKEMAQKLRGSI